MQRRYSIAQVESALRRADGRLNQAARLLGVSRQAIHERVSRTPYLREVMTDIEETLLDLAEGNIRQALRNGDLRITKWFLDRHGRSRGWGRPGPAMETMPDEDAERLVVALNGDVRIFRETLQKLRAGH